MLRTIRVFFIFGILAHLLHSHDVSSIIQQIYTAGSAEDDYYSVDLRALPVVLHILIGIDSTFVPLYSFHPLMKLRGRNFCKVGGL